MYLGPMKSYIIAHDKASKATYSPLLDLSKSDYAKRILACCEAAKIQWC